MEKLISVTDIAQDIVGHEIYDIQLYDNTLLLVFFSRRHSWEYAVVTLSIVLFKVLLNELTVIDSRVSPVSLHYLATINFYIPR